MIYLTGMGDTDTHLHEGLPTPNAPLRVTLVQPSVSAAGQPATVLFSGLTPGLVGVYQINASLPADAASNLEIIVAAGSRLSQPFHFQP